MKRCPHCNRVESDDALVFCRVDGAALVNDSSPLNSESGTTQFGSSEQSNEIGASILSHATDADVSRRTGPTTVLSVQQVGSTSSLPKTKRSVELSKRLGTSLTLLGVVYVQTCRRVEAVLKELKQTYTDHKANGYDIARIYAAMGDKDQAFE